jgi:hypothetical protein
MKRSLAIVCSAALLTLTACGGVDKDATADLLVKDLKKAGTEFTPEQESCVKDAVKSYSEDDLKKLAENKASDELSADFIGKLADCMG